MHPTSPRARVHCCICRVIQGREEWNCFRVILEFRQLKKRKSILSDLTLQIHRQQPPSPASSQVLESHRPSPHIYPDAHDVIRQIPAESREGDPTALVSNLLCITGRAVSGVYANFQSFLFKTPFSALRSLLLRAVASRAAEGGEG